MARPARRRVLCGTVVVMLAAVALTSACTTARVSTAEPGAVPRSDGETAPARNRVECEQEAITGLDSARARLVVRHTAVGMLTWSLIGAGHGAYHGALSYAGAGTGAWIGAAAGAGVGLTIGLVKGWREASGVRASFAGAVDTCLAGSPVFSPP